MRVIWQKDQNCRMGLKWKRKAKLNYKMNLEKELSRNNVGSVWKGMTFITGFKGCETKKIQLPGYDSSSQLALE